LARQMAESSGDGALILGGAGDLTRFLDAGDLFWVWSWWADMSARRYGSSACVYGVDQHVDGFDCFVEVGDRHVEAAGHGGVAVIPVGVGRDLWWPGLPAACGEYALAGVLDGREVLPG
jgi:hypothetical protein